MEDQFRPDGIMEKDAPLQPPATTPGIQHMGGDAAPIPDPLQPLEIEDGREDGANMPSASPVDEHQAEQHAVPVEQSKSKDGSGSSKLPLIYIIVALLVVIGIIVAGVCGSGNCSSKGSSSEEQELSPRDMEGMDIKAQLEKVLGSTYFDGSTVSTEPHQKALNWIIHQDPSQLPPDSVHLLQRFILTQFYYSTSQASPWKFCGAATGAQTAECYFQFLNQEFINERWLSGVSECRWAGCTCEGETENITSIDIWHNDFTGSLPSELGLLSHAIALSLRAQNFTGTIPTEIYQLTALSNLGLSGNNFTGTVNPAVFSMPLLNTLHFSFNHMTGTIPTEIGLFPGKLLFFAKNSFTGTIPSELFSTKNTTDMHFEHNELSGTIPTEVGILSQQVREDNGGPGLNFAGNNALSGTIPSEFGLVNHLKNLYFTDTSIEGTIPEELFLNCLDLKIIIGENCNLGGTLSTNFGLLTNLQYLRLANNNFEGSIPVEFEALTGLKEFTINGNPELRGIIPDDMCFENVWNAQGLEFVADCAPTAITGSDGTTSMGEPFVSCPEGCCSMCCDGGTGICMEQ
ncbi:leucine Rich Repeat [Seminavis robusta]|uniref:Leucine Rich Repeat n=1 Tax=Seminavis robusta TaxID=568900 RepID=A0A9N8DYN8_9STRA|nr:leucine Rich Repeat [Seminavis robusta]|eukprot:Sro475_g150420.1 leucine Rich Repeat (573) ;mRNA; f:29923-31885